MSLRKVWELQVSNTPFIKLVNSESAEGGKNDIGLKSLEFVEAARSNDDSTIDEQGIVKYNSTQICIVKSFLDLQTNFLN